MNRMVAAQSRAVAGRNVSPIGLGALPMSEPGTVGQRDRSLATIHAALDAGVRFLDTAAAYAPRAEEFGHNEVLVGEAVRRWKANRPDRSDEVVVATKGGLTRQPGEIWGRDASPQALLSGATASAQRLGLGVIDLYYLHRLDPAIPFTEQVTALAGVRQAGIARTIGLSNITLQQLERAVDLVGGPADGGIAAVQNEYSPAFRVGGDVLQRCTELGITFVPWSPFGGVSRGEVSDRYAVFHQVAQHHGVSVQQVVLAWLLALGPTVIPIPGATRSASIRDSAAAAHLHLAEDEIAACSATVPSNRSVYPDDTPQPPM